MRGKWCVLLLVLAVGLSALGAQKVYFQGAAGWDPPPVYHGNHFAPGGVGGAYWWVFDPLFVWVPGPGDTIPSGIFAGHDRVIPRLAISYEESLEKFTVKLREGVEWHDGIPFTSRDVWANFTIGYLKGWAIWRYLDRIETPDDHTVVFHWETPTPFAKALIAMEVIRWPYHLYGGWAERVDTTVPIDKEPNATLVNELLAFRPEKPIGTGPFIFKAVTAAEMLLEKNPDYWAADTIDFDGVSLVRWLNNEVVWGYLMAGEIDAAHPATLKETTEEILARNPGMQLALPTDLGEFVVGLNCAKYPFSLKEFRQALIYAIDRSQVREVCYYYALTVDKYAHGVLKSFEAEWLSPEFLAGLEPYEYDPAKAEGILLGLGWKRRPDGSWLDAEGKPVKLEITAAAANSDWVLAAENIARQLTEFGLPCEFRPTPNEIYGDTLKAGEYEMAIEFGTAWWGYAHPWAGYDRLFAPFGYMKTVCSLDTAEPEAAQEAASLVDELAGALTVAEQRPIVEKLAKITNENLPVLPFLEKKLMIFHLEGKRVTGWPAPDDPAWLLCPGGIERFYSTMMIEGVIKAVR